MSGEASIGREHCCEMMTHQVDQRCPQHPDPRECPDSIISYVLELDEYGIYVRDGEGCSASSHITIGHCPWCGRALESKRDLWFAELEGLGFDSPFEQDIPERYRLDEWYRE